MGQIATIRFTSFLDEVDVRRRTKGHWRRQVEMRRWRWPAMAMTGVSGAAVAMTVQAAADGLLAYLVSGLLMLLAVQVSGRLALAGVPVALVAYRGIFELAWRDPPDGLLSLAVATLFLSTVVAALLWQQQLTAPKVSSRGATSSVDHEMFVVLLSKDLARSRRHKTPGTLALFKLRGFDILLRADAYQQHDLIVGRLLRVMAERMRGSDSACYLGNLVFAVALPHTSSEMAQRALERIKSETSEIPRRPCPGLGVGALDWETVYLEYPHNDTPAEGLIAMAARLLSQTAEQRVEHLEAHRVTVRRQLEKLGYA